MRRSGRQSARDSSPLQSGPTVTASGRQVRSRAIGAYGETLHSGQTTDRASPATGEYIRSDVSEEPRQSRSTRTGNRSHLNREMESEEDDDATSWDGGDEEEDEPDQMDLDEDDDDLAEQSSEEEPESLVVTLHYRKKPSNTFDQPKSDLAKTNGAPHSVDVPMADNGATSETKAPASLVGNLSSESAPSLPHILPTAISNGWSVRQADAIVTPKIEEHQEPVPIQTEAEANTLPKLEGLFAAPTPPYSAPEDAPKRDQPRFQPVQPQAAQQPPYATTLPVNNPAPSWQ